MDYFNQNERQPYKINTKFIKTNESETVTEFSRALALNDVTEDQSTTKVLTINDSNFVKWKTVSGGGANPFDQDLNTVNAPTFSSMSYTSLLPNNNVERILVLLPNGQVSYAAEGLTTPRFASLLLESVANDNTETNLLTWNAVDKMVEYRTVASLPSGNPFDQSLNTTDSVTFSGVNTNTATISSLANNTTSTQSVISNAGVLSYKDTFHISLGIATPQLVNNIGLDQWSEILGIWNIESSRGQVSATVPGGLITTTTTQKAKFSFHVSFDCTSAGQLIYFGIGSNPSNPPVNSRAAVRTTNIADATYQLSFTNYYDVGTAIPMGLWYKNSTSTAPITIRSATFCCENV